MEVGAGRVSVGCFTGATGAAASAAGLAAGLASAFFSSTFFSSTFGWAGLAATGAASGFAASTTGAATCGATSTTGSAALGASTAGAAAAGWSSGRTKVRFLRVSTLTVLPAAVWISLVCLRVRVTLPSSRAPCDVFRKSSNCFLSCSVSVSSKPRLPTPAFFNCSRRRSGDKFSSLANCFTFVKTMRIPNSF